MTEATSAVLSAPPEPSTGEPNMPERASQAFTTSASSTPEPPRPEPNAAEPNAAEPSAAEPNAAVPLPLDQFLLGDCVTRMEGLPSGSVALIFADPPYNLSGKGMQWEGKEMGGNWYKVNEAWDTMSREAYGTFTERWLKEAVRLLKPAGSLYVCCTLHNLGVLMVTLEGLGMRCNNVITWYKPNAMPSMTRRSYTHATELVLYFVKGPGWTYNYDLLKTLNPDKREDGGTRQMRDLWTFPLCQGKERLRGPDKRALHPTQKPEALVTRAVLASSLEGEVVLDPFMGSGTTAVVARRYGRHFIGIEREARYIEAAAARLAQVSRVPLGG